MLDEAELETKPYSTTYFVFGFDLITSVDMYFAYGLRYAHVLYWFRPRVCQKFPPLSFSICVSADVLFPKLLLVLRFIY